MGALEHAFGQVVRDLREQQGLSQEDLAVEFGRHRTFVSLIERGANSASLTTVWAICDALRASPTEVIRRVERRLSAPEGSA